MKRTFIIVLILFLSPSFIVNGQQLDEWNYKTPNDQPIENAVSSEYQFNGYTNYWHDTYSTWYRYGNLYKMAVLNVEKSIMQSKVNIAEDMSVPGLLMQEGFINFLFSKQYSLLDQPSQDELEEALKNKNVLIFVSPDSEVGKKVNSKYPSGNNWPAILKSHQYGAFDLKRADAFYLENGERKLFVVSSTDKKTRDRMKKLIERTKEIVETYNLHKGWFGAETLLKSVTCTDGHPLDVIGKGMNEGNSWFVFNGYMDYLAKDELNTWMDQVDLPVVTDVGFSPVYGCRDYDGFQNQRMFTKDSWINFAKEKGGYVFRQVWDTVADPYHYDGYFANEGNKEQIDNEDVPFVLKTGRLDNNALSSMVLFLEKGTELTQKTMWEAILDRREVGILAEGKMMGPAIFRNALQILLLDKEYLEEYFGEQISIESTIDGYNLQVTVKNNFSLPVSGELSLKLPATIKIKSNTDIKFDLSANGTKTLQFVLEPTINAMDNTNPIAVHFKWNGKKKSTMTMLDLPPAISVHRLLYGHTPKVNYPVTIHNFTNKSSFPVKVQVVASDNEKKVIYKTSQISNAVTGKFQDMLFELDLPAGNYKVKVSALGIDYASQLGVGKAEGKPYAYALDLNSDGVDEFRMENDSVQITLLATGARVIEYIVKSRNDNVLFKLWPKKAIDDKRSFRKRGYYPYGGFEDFLGQGSMETHQVYQTEIIKKEGDFVRVRMWTEYFGNKLEKTFTLYGDSPLLEVRFALTFKNPEANVLGPQPILELGKKHWTEDVFMVPDADGIVEMRMKPEKYYGHAFLNIKEGWNAGYDTKEDITFVGAFPVDQPLFLHMWMNHPSNGEAHHYYTEFQPWLPIFQKSTMYFTYYLWGAGGPWENGVKELRDRNLISKINNN